MGEVNTLQDIFNACCMIPDNRNTTDTVISISYGILEEGQVLDLPVRTIFHKVNMRFAKSGNYVLVDLRFANHMDPKLGRALELLDAYQKDCGEAGEEDYPTFHISFLPNALRGEFHIVFANPVMHALCSRATGEYPSVIRMLFEDEDVVVMQNSDIDYAKLVAEAKRRADMEEFYEEEEEKKRKKEAYEAEFGFNKADSGYGKAIDGFADES